MWVCVGGSDAWSQRAATHVGVSVMVGLVVVQAVLKIGGITIACRRNVARFGSHSK